MKQYYQPHYLVSFCKQNSVTKYFSSRKYYQTAYKFFTISKFLSVLPLSWHIRLNGFKLGKNMWWWKRLLLFNSEWEFKPSASAICDIFTKHFRRSLLHCWNLTKKNTRYWNKAYTPRFMSASFLLQNLIPVFKQIASLSPIYKLYYCCYELWPWRWQVFVCSGPPLRSPALPPRDKVIWSTWKVLTLKPVCWPICIIIGRHELAYRNGEPQVLHLVHSGSLR